MKDLVFLGKIKKIYDENGSIIIKTNVPSISTKFIFVEINGTYIPFKIVNHEFVKDTSLVVKLLHINDNKSAAEIIGHNVFIETDNKIIQNDDAKGYSVVDEDKNTIGIVENILKNNMQSLLDVKRVNKDNFYIPYTDEFIIEINKTNKTISIKNLYKLVM